MKVTQIVVSAGRTFNHPHEEYSNLKPHISLTVTLEDGDDPIVAAKTLQQSAEQLVEDHKANLLKSIEDAYHMGEAQRQMVGLSRQLQNAQEEIDRIRKQWPGLKQIEMNVSD